MRVHPARPIASAACVVAALLLAACASSSKRTASPRPSGGIYDPTAGMINTARIESGATTQEIATTNTPSAPTQLDLAVPPERAFQALLGAYESLGIQVNVVQTNTRTLGARDMRAVRRLGKTPLSRYLDCGQDMASGALADTYVVSLTAVTRVVAADAERSTLVTQVSAGARPVNISGGIVRCGTTGRLEQEINKAAALAAVR
jgi:hypothetical protein